MFDDTSVAPRRTGIEKLFLAGVVSEVTCLTWYFASGSRSFWTYLWMIGSALAVIVIARRNAASPGDGMQTAIATMTARVLRRRRGPGR